MDELSLSDDIRVLSEYVTDYVRRLKRGSLTRKQILSRLDELETVVSMKLRKLADEIDPREPF